MKYELPTDAELLEACFRRGWTTDSLAMAAYCDAIAHGGIPLPMREVLETMLDVCSLMLASRGLSFTKTIL